MGVFIILAALACFLGEDPEAGLAAQRLSGK